MFLVDGLYPAIEMTRISPDLILTRDLDLAPAAEAFVPEEGLRSLFEFVDRNEGVLAILRDDDELFSVDLLLDDRIGV